MFNEYGFELYTYKKTVKQDGTIEVEIQAITGATNELGFNKMSAKGV